MTEDTIQKGSTHTFIKTGLYLIIICLILFSFLIDAYATTLYWVGASGDDWNDTTHWSTVSGGSECGGSGTAGEYPEAGDTAIFNVNCTNNITLDAAVTVDAITNTGGYSGTFNTGNYALIVNGDFQWDGGTFTAGSSTLTVDGNWDSSGGTFTSGTGTITMTGPSKTFSAKNFTTFYNLIIDSNATVDWSTGAFCSINDLTINSGATFTLNKTTIQSEGGDITIASDATFTINLYFFRNVSNSSDHISTVGTIDGAGLFDYLVVSGSTTAPITARTYGIDVAIAGEDASATGVLGGGTSLDLGSKGLYIYDSTHDWGWAHGTLDTNNINIVAGALQVGHANHLYGKLICGSSTIDINGNVTISASDGSGTNEIDADTATFNVAGNWTNNDTFTADTGTNTVDFNGTVAQSITSGGDPLYNLTISNTSDTVSLADDLSLLAGGTLTINAGATLDLNGNNLTVPTTFNNNGTLQLEGGETVSTPTNNSGSLVKYDGTGGPLKNWTYDSLQLSSLAVTTYNMPGPLTLNGSLTIDASNTLVTNNNNLNVGGDWTNNGTFTAGTGTVTLDGTGTQDIWSGGSDFSTIEITNSSNTVTFTDDLTATNFTSNTGSVAMKFTAGDDYTITNLTLNGAPGNRITLRSTVLDTQWNLNVSGAQSLSYVDVSDSNASGGNPVVCSNECIGLNENNDNWVGLLVAIPTMTEWGMIIFMVLAGLGSIYYLRRQRTV